MLVIFMLVVMRSSVFLPNFFMVNMGITLKLVAPSTITWLNTLPLIVALMNNGLRRFTIFLFGLSKNIPSLFLSLVKETHSVYSTKVSHFSSLGCETFPKTQGGIRATVSEGAMLMFVSS